MDDGRTTEALGADLPLRALVRECRLVLPDGTIHQFAAERMVIGADPHADFCIASDSALSKFHCEIRISGGTAAVRDLKSRNGTFVDHVPVFDAPLRDGALLRIGRTELRFEVGSRQVEVPISQKDRFGRLTGQTVAMRQAFALIEAAAASTSTVLLQGESGTGKDLAAEALHQESPRSDGPFVVVDCGAIPHQLLEAELFGYEAGAFTGAHTQRIGAFEAASGGTLFLDEIGELSLDLQPKLLRALDRREIQRIGSTQRIEVDVRVIAATNRELFQEVNERRFRSDLYFRLAILVVTMPPLRERTNDIPLLVSSMVDELAAHDTTMGKSLKNELMPELMRHAWPGNVRELRNYIESCIVRQELSRFSGGERGEPSIEIETPLRVVRENWVRHVERKYLEKLLAAHRGNVTAAAKASGLDRVHMYRLLHRTGLR